MPIPHNPEEKLAIVNEQYDIIGEETRENIHEQGLLHREVFCYLINDDKVLLSRRSDNQRWDHSFAGHFPYDQDYEEAATREGNEELGIQIDKDKLEELTHRRITTTYQKTNDRFIKVFLYKTKKELAAYTIDPGEVAEIRYFGISEIENLIRDEEQTTASMREIMEEELLPLLKRPIGLTTGAVHSWTDNLEEQLAIMRRVGMQAIEIIFPHPQSLDEEISNQAETWVRTRSYVSIHAPFYEDSTRTPMVYDHDERTRKTIARLESWQRRLGAKAIVLHQDLVKDWSLLNASALRLALENLPQDQAVSIEAIKEVMKNQKPKSIVLDTAHALTYNDEMIKTLINEFKNTIQHIHLSDRRFSTYHQRVRDHEQIRFCTNTEKFAAIRELQTPIIIEVSIKDKKNDLENLKEEINSVKTFLKERKGNNNR